MTYEEALNWCEQFTDNLVAYDGDTQRRTLGLQAMEVCKKAIMKQIPKKIRIDNESWYCCPKCDETFKLIDQFKKRNKCCGNCGQALDWSDTNA